MKKADFKQLKEWSESKGYHLNPKLDYKNVAGVGGIYATDDINQFEVLYRGPGRVISGYDDMLNLSLEYLADIVREYQKGKESDIWPMFNSFQSIEDLKKTSIVYATPDELSMLGSFSKSAANLAVKYQSKIQKIKLNLKELLGDDTSMDDIMFVLLNSEARSWGEGGFNPILDLFNHNNIKAMSRTRVGVNDYVLGAKVNYKKGEQVYNSYGVHDIFHFIESYGFYDPADLHLIDVALRVDFQLDGDVQERQLAELSKHFDVIQYEPKNEDATARFKISNGGMYMTQVGPSHNLLKAIDIMARKTQEQMDNPKLTPYDNYINVFAEWLNLFSSTNTVELVDKSQLTDRLIPYYDAALKEKQIIEYNTNWLQFSSHMAPIFGTMEFGQKVIQSDLENQK
jgi:hypothetical protein